MTRDYFVQTTSLVPPRGLRVEMTEIRPLRPNQAIILPGVAVLGHKLKYEVSFLKSFIDNILIENFFYLFLVRDVDRSYMFTFLFFFCFW